MQDIRTFVDEYRLDADGVRFWAPYWVNDPELMAAAYSPRVPGAFKGKGTPAQLTLSLKRALAHTSRRPASANGYRELMRSKGLGIDCSGFVYHVLSGCLRAAGLRALPQILVVSRSDVLIAMKEQDSWKGRGVSEAEVKGWSALVSIQQVCNRFHKQPRKLVAVSTLVHPQVVDSVLKVRDIRPGDLIKFTSKQWGDHIVVVVENQGSQLIIAESTEPEGELGGVRYASVSITHPEKGWEKQDWQRNASFHPGGSSRDGVWRLKEMA